jgi:hypothetical protein
MSFLGYLKKGYDYVSTALNPVRLVKQAIRPISQNGKIKAANK